MKAMISIDNPEKHISHDDKPKGMFYSAANFPPPSIIDVFLNRTIMSKLKFEEHCDKLPATPEEITKEVAFEQMKLEYIRSMKMARFACAFKALVFFVVSGGVIWNAYLLMQ